AADAALDGARIAVTVGDHPLEHGDVRLQVFGHAVFGQGDGTACSGTLGGGVRQFERLLDGEIFQAFDFEDAAVEDVLLAGLLDGQQAFFDRLQRNRMHQVTQGDARLALALEAHQYGFRHVQRHNASRGSKGNETRAGREGNAQRETRVRVAAGADGVRQQHAVQPGVDDAVARTQRNTATVHDEVR